MTAFCDALNCFMMVLARYPNHDWVSGGPRLPSCTADSCRTSITHPVLNLCWRFRVLWLRIEVAERVRQVTKPCAQKGPMMNPELAAELADEAQLKAAIRELRKLRKESEPLNRA